MAEQNWQCSKSTIEIHYKMVLHASFHFATFEIQFMYLSIGFRVPGNLTSSSTVEAELIT